MALARWTRLATSLVHENPWWRYWLHTFVQPNGERGEYHAIQTHGSVMVVPIEADGSLVLVEQYRFLADRDSLEFPAGAIDEGESPMEAARRELAEEAHLAGDLVPIGAFCPWNGVTDELCHVFVATNLTTIADPPAADTTEEFVVLRLSPAELAARIVDGTEWDGMTLAALAMFHASNIGP
jgi:ADP-ribose pyrophosphatase